MNKSHLVPQTLPVMLLACIISEAPAQQLQFKDIAPRLSFSQAIQASSGKAVPHQRHPSLAYGGGSYMLVWQDGYNGVGGDSNINGIRLDENGQPIEKTPIAVCADSGNQDSAIVAFCAGKFLVTWSDFRNGNDYDVYAALLDKDGILAKKPFVVAGGKGGQVNSSITSDGKNTFFVTWQDHRSGKHFQVYGARISADKGEVLDTDGVLLMDKGASSSVVFGGKDYLVSIGSEACLVGADGKLSGKALKLWSSDKHAAPATAAAWGKMLSFYNTSPSPDPWGWGGDGAIIGTSVLHDGTSPEFAWAKHGWYDLAKDQSDRVVKNVIEAARWKNHSSWPMGMPGGFKGSHDGTWPSGATAAAFNGRSMLVVWNAANFVDVLRIANRDIYLKRVLDSWAYVDEPRVKLVAGPTDEVSPALCAGKTGDALLAYEYLLPAGGIQINHHILRETEDTVPPKVRYIVHEGPTTMRITFDEPVDTESASQAANYTIDGTAVKSAAFVKDNPALMRQVILETEPQTPGKTYTVKVQGVKDLSPAKNAAAGEAYEYLCKAGRASKGDFIENWLVVGPFPNDWNVDLVDLKNTRPAPGGVVKARTTDELKEMARKLVGEDESKKAGWDAEIEKTFAGDKTWKKGYIYYGHVLRISHDFGKANNACMYANTYVFSDRDREILIRADSNDGNRIYLNGETISSNPAKPTRGFHDSTDEVEAKLKKGWNQLTIQVENKFGEWLMTAQITDRAKQPIPDLTYQLENPAEQK